MSRTQRLLDLLQILRTHRYPVTGVYLADKLNVSVRTLYRDIRTLQDQGAHIEGEAGIGYVLKPGYMLPPLMFSKDEIEALVLGSRWVSKRGDSELKIAAKGVLSKISAVLPDELRYLLESSTLLIGPNALTGADDVILLQLRHAFRTQCKMSIDYLDQKNEMTKRIIWPFALGYFDAVHILIAWCELREQFRHFRIDRIMALTIMDQRFPRSRQQLLKEWQQIEGITTDEN